MKLRVLLLLSAALAATTVQAVVQPGRNQQLFNHNRDGYRYNGPAHKYLPAEGPPSTEAGIITGPWQSHGSHGNHIPQSLEQQHGSHGPYNTQHYGQGQEQHRQEEHSWQQVQHQQQRPEPWQTAQGLEQQPVFQQHQEQYHQQHQSQSHHQQSHQDVAYSTEHQGRPAEHHQQGFLLQQESHQQRPESWQATHGQAFPQEQHQQQPHHQQEHEQQQQQQEPLGTHWQPSQLGHNSERFPLALAHASSHKTVAAPARDIKLVPAYTLSSYSDQDRFIGLDALDTRLLSQSLPDVYQRVTFNAGQPSRQQGLGQVQGQRHEELLGGSPQQQHQHQQSQDYVQMQSHSYQLPSSHTMQREWPHHQQQQQHNSGNRQYSESAFALSSNPSPHASSHSSNPSYASNPSYSQQNSLSHPSREFQPPYYR
ncbi:putative cyclin-dependent serine/threonine-protein kinase DDB_G0272797/DDB_G0274007 [Drosophila subobscura]|uniref:putative cyclin-dependent serine/threonine-protein kinase DDB_G0272797/DDB_G0274007 n=1 Tax=Drosophila subobscura TaxID=7241 RepID=UPI00155A8C8F|nr:putative cyclin-dependent serine/threonine-protein kinase DDB_G0272797/DDB_G0274007 [Drosophila subobscura]